VGGFTYSPIAGAAANALPDPVPEEVKHERLARLMAVQEAISRAKLQQKVGKTLTVLVDEIQGKQAVARSMADAPEVDGVVYIENGPEVDGVVYIENGARLKAGEFCEVTVTHAGEHDLRARAAKERKHG